MFYHQKNTKPVDKMGFVFFYGCVTIKNLPNRVGDIFWIFMGLLGMIKQMMPALLICLK